MARALLPLALLALLALLAPAEAQVSRPNVCTRSQAQQYYIRERYTVSCGFLGWSSCSRYRVVQRTRYVTEHFCCSGYSAVGTECQPVCNGVAGDAGCHAPHGSCDSPGNCTCQEGYSAPDCTKPCDTYTLIKNEYKRSIAYFTPTGDVSLCDLSLSTGWYRFQGGAGEDLVNRTECQLGQCGTIFPVCMEGGDLPTEEEGEVNRTACRLGFNGCGAEWTIRVMACRDGQSQVYRVYHLPPSDVCPSAYCVGSEAPCPLDQCSETDFTPCVPDCPWNVTLSPRIVAGSEDHGVFKRSTLIFRCEFTPPPQQLLYDVYWFVNDVQVARFLRLPSNRVSTNGSLQEDAWKDTTSLNMVVKCSLRARFNESRPPTRHQYSDPFFAGLEVNETEIIVKEGKSEFIRVRSTVPLPYIRLPAGPQAQMDVHVFSPKSQFSPDIANTDVVFSRGKCRVPLTSTIWTKLEVTAAKDNSYKRTRISMLRLGVERSELDVNDVWNGMRLPDVRIIVWDEDSRLSGKFCQSLNDPHMSTFNRRGYENQREGEFILYKHILYPFSVHTKYQNCRYDWWATCNCGVAIRSYSSLLVVDRCFNQAVSYRAPNNHIAYTGCNARHLLVTAYRNKYTVTLPTGTEVKFTLYDGGLNPVEVFPSPADVDLTRGLCGRLSSTNANNDFVFRDGTTTNDDQLFAVNWKVNSRSESLFVADPTFETRDPVLPYCVCNEKTGTQSSNSVSCSYPYPTYQGPQRYSSNLRALLRTCGDRANRDLRASDYVSDGPSGWEDESQLSGTQQEHERRRRSTELDWRDGWTEATAREHCRQAFNSSRGVALMEEATGFTSVKEDLIETCILDIKYTASTYYTQFTVEAFKDVCEEEVQKNVTLLDTEVGRSLVEEIANASCPMDCSGRGACQEGQCHCEEGFLGVDCSIERSTPPQNPYIPQQGLCNTRERACLSTPVLASNLPETGTVFCGFRAFQVLEDGIRNSSQRSITVAEPWTQGQVQCPFPRTRARRQAQSDVMAEGYMVSVSNDNVTYSSEVAVIIYDAQCLSCSTDNLTCLATGPCDTTTGPTPASTSSEVTPTSSETTSAPSTPTSESSAPTSASPVPTSASSTPTSESPAPTSASSAPTSASSAPTSESPAPTSESPAPTSESSVPTSESPVPTSESPVPTSASSAPTSESPAPTSASSVPTSESSTPTSESSTSLTTVSEKLETKSAPSVVTPAASDPSATEASSSSSSSSSSTARSASSSASDCCPSTPTGGRSPTPSSGPTTPPPGSGSSASTDAGVGEAGSGGEAGAVSDEGKQLKRTIVISLSVTAAVLGLAVFTAVVIFKSRSARVRKVKLAKSRGRLQTTRDAGGKRTPSSRPGTTRSSALTV